LCILWLALPACNEDEDPDTLTNLACDELVEGYLRRLRHHAAALDGAYPSHAKARQYCRDDENTTGRASTIASSTIEVCARRWRCVWRNAHSIKSANRS
jgi:hypothetical protein